MYIYYKYIKINLITIYDQDYWLMVIMELRSPIIHHLQAGDPGEVVNV